MARVKAKKLRWNVEGLEADIVAHYVYWSLTGAIDQDNSDYVRVEMPKDHLIFPDEVPELPADVDQEVAIAVTAVDDVGNESDLVGLTVPFDFTAPAAPTGVVVEDVG